MKHMGNLLNREEAEVRACSLLCQVFCNGTDKKIVVTVKVVVCKKSFRFALLQSTQKKIASICSQIVCVMGM